MARERDDQLYAALTRQYNAARAEVAEVEESFRWLEAEQTTAQSQKPEQQVEAALAMLDDMMQITTAPQSRAEVNSLLRRLGVRIGLPFGSVIKGKKRVVQRLLSGRMVFGDAPLRVPLFGKDNVDDKPTGTMEGDQRKQEQSSEGEPGVAATASGFV